MAQALRAERKVVQRQGNRREKLLEAAARRFLHQGFAAASMRDIASDAGMQPGSIYYHFPSKAEMLVAVHEEGMRRITEAVTGALDGVSGPWKRLEAACIAHLTALLEGGVFFQAVMRELPRETDTTRGRITRMRDAYEGIFATLLDDLDLPPDVDRRDLRLMLLGSMNWSFTWYRPGAEPPAGIARTFLGYLRRQLERPGA
ncbi:MAG: TetR/AcrR family transcriptional regulator [Hyphomicrobiales bacterium]|nr:TetR/AcrR family transcriptional regulator [Hyphomicrobiales bacterium]MCP5371980.1 TetR/AcrR family transcriptional regulator [Hyphomicrobiales bacterium]